MGFTARVNHVSDSEPEKHSKPPQPCSVTYTNITH